MDSSEVKKLKEQLDQQYSGLRTEQDKDWGFYTDAFPVPQIDTNLQHIQRTGRARRMVDRPAEHIVTSNPQAFITHKLKTKLESANKIAEMFNQIWFPYLKWQNPNPIKESVKKTLLRGETYLKILHNEDWVTAQKDANGEEIKGKDNKPIFLKQGLPIHFLVPDSRNIYVEVDKYGQITKVIVYHQRQAWQVKAIYPDWTTDEEKAVDWLECWDEGERYFEADNKQVFHGVNPYGLIPFVRALSGFGIDSAEGKLEDLVVGRLRFERDTLTRECAMVTDFDSIFHLFANMNVTVQPIDSLQSIPKDFRKIYTRKKGSVIELPYGIKVDRDVETLPSAEAYTYLYSIEADLDRSDPLVMGGLPVGTSGRQDDLAMINAMRRYETVVENIEHLFSQGLKIALKIVDKIPTLRDSVGLSKKDMDDDYQISVKLKAADPIEADRKLTAGDRLWAAGNGSISLERFHTQYQGMTQDESKKEIAKMLVDRLTLYNPDVASVMGMVFAEESGMDKWLKEAQARRAQMEQQGRALQEQPAPTTMERIQGEVKTPLGREMMDMALENRGVRHSPEGYTRS